MNIFSHYWSLNRQLKHGNITSKKPKCTKICTPFPCRADVWMQHMLRNGIRTSSDTLRAPVGNSVCDWSNHPRCPNGLVHWIAWLLNPGSVGDACICGFRPLAGSPKGVFEILFGSKKCNTTCGRYGGEFYELWPGLHMGTCNPAMDGVVAQFARPNAQVAVHNLVIIELSASVRIWGQIWAVQWTFTCLCWWGCCVSTDCDAGVCPGWKWYWSRTTGCKFATSATRLGGKLRSAFRGFVNPATF